MACSLCNSTAPNSGFARQGIPFCNSTAPSFAGIPFCNSTPPSLFGSPTTATVSCHHICANCLENAKRILTLCQKLGDANLPDEAAHTDRTRGFSSPTVPKELAQAFNKIKQFQDAIVEKSKFHDAHAEKLKFLEELTIAFREGIEPDVRLAPRDGPSIHAHRVVMATKSSVFRNMFETDEFKALHGDSIPMPDMNHDQLKCLVEFLYSGCIPGEKIQQHGPALLIAGDKYDIPLLSKICEAHIAGSVDQSNVLEMLDLAAVCSAAALKETAINTILKHRDEVIFSKEYENFAVKNPLLSVEITKAVLRDTKTK